VCAGLAWKENMRLREQELLTLPGRDERWENFMLYTQGTFWSRLVCLNTFNTLFNVCMRRSWQGNASCCFAAHVWPRCSLFLILGVLPAVL
jgi:hypothetical protein